MLIVVEKLFLFLDEDLEMNDENAFGKWLFFRVVRSGTRKEGGFIEV